MMLFPLLFFAFGALAASFAGVVAERAYTGQSFLFGRSRCDACGAPLSPLSLVPIISYLVSGGRAGCCGARLSPLSPAMELFLGGLFILSYLSVGLTLALPFFLLALTTLLALVRYDLAHQILPPLLLWSFVALAALAGLLLAPSFSAFGSSLFTAALIGAFLASLHFLSRGRAMGLADAPLAFGLSLLTGQAAFPGFIFSFWLGALFGLILLAGRPPGSRMGVEVPFAPYLAAGFLLAYFTQWNPFALIAALLSSN